MVENKILIVDDEEDILDVLGLYLSNMGYEVLIADSGEDAMHIFTSENPPIIISDIKMPGIDGIELLKMIKQENPDTEVIMITGHGEMELAIESLKYEATDFVTKPIHDDILEIALKRAHEKISMRQKIKKYTQNLEQMVEEKTRKLIEAERLAAIGETISGLSHAIKNIAGGLKGGMFVLEKGIELDKKKYLLEGWEMVRGNVDKITNLSMELLNYGKSAEVNYQLADPNRPAAEVANLMRSRAHELGIDLKMNLIPDFNPDKNTIRFDPEGIHHALMNLVTNAIDAFHIHAFHDDKAEDDKVKKILVTTARTEDGGVEYRVSDNGCGMEKEIRENIFRTFFSTKGIGGTGIGLMMTKRIIDQHQGIIEVESEKGAGSTFIIRLPAR